MKLIVIPFLIGFIGASVFKLSMIECIAISVLVGVLIDSLTKEKTS